MREYNEYKNDKLKVINAKLEYSCEMRCKMISKLVFLIPLLLQPAGVILN